VCPAAGHIEKGQSMLLEVEGEFKAEIFLEWVRIFEPAIFTKEELIAAVADIRGTSRSDARRVLSQGGVTIDDVKIDENTEIRSPKEDGTFPVLRTGKKWKTKIFYLDPPSSRDIPCLAVLREGEETWDLLPMKDVDGTLVNTEAEEMREILPMLKEAVERMNSVPG
jgi:hypothetical protein